MMKLRWSATSPYVRKVVIAMFERGLNDRVELVPTDAWSPATTLPEHNPLGKVPTLVLEDGSSLFDSPVICEYLDSLPEAVGTPLFPPAGPARWNALRLQALGDGLNDAAVLRRLEGNRPDGQRSPDWMERQRQAMLRSCNALEERVGDLDGPFTIGTAAVLAALGYLDFRYGHEDWRPGRPKLAEWFEQASKRSSFVNTRPPQ
jgi:glutathione S-transferase